MARAEKSGLFFHQDVSMLPIASRTLWIVEGDERRPVVIRLFMPEEDDGSWKCAYEIGWPEKVRSFAMSGVDAVQSLELAMQMIGTELYLSEFHEAETLVLDEPGSGYGFPVAKSVRDLLVGNDKTSYG